MTVDDGIPNGNQFTKEAPQPDLLLVVQAHFQPSYIVGVLFYSFSVFVVISRYIALSLTRIFLKPDDYIP